jgi:hypothetical protein
MSAGSIQLAAIGQQDAFLTGTPSVTYFQGVYSRNTPFVLEAYDIPFNGTKQAFGTQAICKIPFKGDVVRGLTLKTNMPFLKNPGNDWNWSNVASENGFYPQIIVDGVYIRAPTQGVTYYSTNVDSQTNVAIGWMTYPAPLLTYTSASTGPVTGTAITLPFASGNVIPNVNVFAGDVGSVTGVTGAMLVSSATTTSVTFTINSQTTTTIPASTLVSIQPASGTFTLTTQLTMPANPTAVTSIVVPLPANVWGVNVFSGYTATMSGITGTMTATSLSLATATYANVTYTIPSQTTASIPSGTVVTIRKARVLAANVFYNANVNKYQFTAYSNVEVAPGLATFWGLDPKNFDSILPSGNLNYIISTTSAHPTTVGSLPFPPYPRAFSDFTLEQGGWTRGSGIPSAEKRTGLYFQVNNGVEASATPTSTQFQMYSNYLFFNTSRNLYIAQVSGSTFCFQTIAGNVAFSKGGQYCIRGNLQTNYPDSIYSVAYTFSTTDVVPPLNFVSEHVISTTSQPTPTFTIPINVTLTGQYVYMSIFIRLNRPPASGSGILAPGSWIAVAPLDQFFSLASTSATGQQLALQNFTSYPVVSGGSIVALNPTSNSFTFQKTGTFLMTTVLALQNSILTGVKLSYGTRGSGTEVYNYTTTQGTIGYPSMDLTIPVNVTPTSLGPYYLDITMQNLSGSVTTDTFTAGNTCYICIVQNASLTPTTSYTENGLLIRPSASFFTMPSPIDFSAGSWSVPIGGTNIISIAGNKISFTAGGLYYMQMILCTNDTLKTVTVTITGGSSLTTTYPIGVGVLPPYSLGIPFYIPTASTIVPALASISYVTSTGITATAYSNTAVAIGPLASNVTDVFSYVDSIGTYVIQNAELRIGGQLIQTLTGEQIELYNDLYVPYENQPGLKLLVGKQDSSNVFDPGRSYYTNLPFYFYGNNELSIPIAALSRSDVEIAVTFRQFSDLSFVSNISSINQTMSATIIVEYGYLSENEVKWMQKSRLEYLITQTQATSFVLPSNFSTGTFKLPFNNPVREIYIVIQNESTAPYDFTNNGLTNVGLLFNGQEYLSRQVIDAQYLQYVQAFQKYNVTPTRKFYVYSFANDPMNPRPTGQINFSRMKDTTLDITCSPLAGLRRYMRVYATNYNVLRIENGLAGVMFNFT